MKKNRHSSLCAVLLIALLLTVAIATRRLRADTGSCGGQVITLPFTDVPAASVFFCSIAEAFFSGLTNGTTSTTYSPIQNVPREQMSAFVTRTMDQSLKRGSRRAALKQFWTPTSLNGVGLTFVGAQPSAVESDGADLWVAHDSGTINRVSASDGKLLDTWTGATNASGLVVARGSIFVAGTTYPGSLYRIDPTLPGGAVTTMTHFLGGGTIGIAYDGARIWTSNGGGSVSIVTLNPFTVTNVTTGFLSLVGILYDGVNIWVVDLSLARLQRLDSNGAIIQSVPLGQNPWFPAFDGTNIWVPNLVSNDVTVIRASTGAVVATLTGNGLDEPHTAAFDGERMLVTNTNGSSVSLWKSADLTPLGSIPLGQFIGPNWVCSDGINFWVTFRGTGQLARF